MIRQIGRKLAELEAGVQMPATLGERRQVGYSYEIPRASLIL